MEGKSLTIGYWGIQGRGQPLRYLLEYHGIPYTEERFTNQDDWFGKRKPELAKLTPFPNLPFIMDGDLVITEQIACLQYAASKVGGDMLGKNEIDRIKIAQIFGVTMDLWAKIRELCFHKDFETIKDSFIAETIKPFLDKLSANKGEKAYCAVDYMTWVDFPLFHLLNILEQARPGALDNYPSLREFYRTINEQEKIKAFKQSDRFPKMIFPAAATFNGPK